MSDWEQKKLLNESIQNETISKIMKERDEKILALDEEWAWQLLKEGGVKHKPGRKFILAGLHKARYHMPNAPQELKEKSKKWLETRNFKPTSTQLL